MPKYTVTLSGMIHASYTVTVSARDEDAAIEKAQERAERVGPKKFELDWQGDELDGIDVEEA